MSLVDKIKGMFGICTCKHTYQTRFDEEFVLEDESEHTFQIEYCTKCGKIKSIEEIK